MKHMPTSRAKKLVSCIMYVCLIRDLKLETIKKITQSFVDYFKLLRYTNTYFKSRKTLELILTAIIIITSAQTVPNEVGVSQEMCMIVLGCLDMGVG